MMYQRQQGQALLECMVTLAVLLTVSVWAASAWNRSIEEVRIKAMASWLLDIQRAIGRDTDFLDMHKVLLKNGVSGNPGKTGWVGWLKQQGRLPESFSDQPPLSFEIDLVPVETPLCQSQSCVRELLLIARPELTRETSEQVAMEMLLALQGQGAAVLAPHEHVLKGPTMQHKNPLPGRSQLPAGTVALSVWHSGHLAPYVRLQEDRPVHLSGEVVLGANTYFEKPIVAQQGVVFTEPVAFAAPCVVPGQLARLDIGGLGLCEQGRWRSVVASRALFKSCNNLAAYDSLGPKLWSDMVLPGFSSNDFVLPCECAGGFVPRFLGKSRETFEGVRVMEGFVCESHA